MKMATKKRIVKSNNQELIEEVTSDPKHPLVFISHDTRDAELAEEFSNLLKSASAGALKSFRSSDKKGATGIEYGQEWYQAIMNKLYEASEVVCLLTQRSVDRPWILYEAGVAKGKSDRKVIGIALGLHTSVAFTGPFAQFQNNDGSVESVTKLVLDLVRKVPGLDPDQQLVSQLVEKFDKRSKEIIMKIQKQPKEDKKESSEKIVAKLFEEVKIMYEALPAKIENRIDPEFRRRKRKMQPFMIEELLHIAKISEDPAIEFMIILSFYKEDYPIINGC